MLPVKEHDRIFFYFSKISATNSGSATEYGEPATDDTVSALQDLFYPLTTVSSFFLLIGDAKYVQRMPKK